MPAVFTLLAFTLIGYLIAGGIGALIGVLVGLLFVYAPRL